MDDENKSATASASSRLGTVEWAIILSSVSVILLALFITVIALFIKAKTKHLRLLADLEQRGITLSQSIARVQEHGSNRNRTVLRRNSLLPYLKTGGWGSLNSREDIGASREALRNRTPIVESLHSVNKGQTRLSWPFAKRPRTQPPVRLQQLSQQRLSAIAESPAVTAPMSPTLARSEYGGDVRGFSMSPSRLECPDKVEGENPLFNSESLDSPSLHPQPLFSNRTEGPQSISEADEAVQNNINQEANGAVIVHQQRPPRSLIHTRSGSRTAPEHPVPPLPLVSANRKDTHHLKPYLYDSPSRTSVSSMDSAGSSILIGGVSPGALRKDGAQLKRGARREWHKSVIIGHRPRRDTLMLRSRPALRSQSPAGTRVPRYSVDSMASKRQSLTDPVKAPIAESLQRLSLPDLDSVDVPRLHRRSTPVSIIQPNLALSTPRRQSRSRVSPSGSPAERKRFSVLRDVSGNEGFPSRQSSRASTRVSSTRSSNGNPFQWDPALLETGKPSALKGSPRARRGHKRQNCVRISLAPTILGPQSRSTTPLNIPNIMEEPSDLSANGDTGPSGDVRFTQKAVLPSESTLVVTDIKVNTNSAMASSATDSPLLSVTQYAQDAKQGYFNFNLTPRTSPHKRGSRCSATSSLLSIPKFPSPVHGPGPPHAITTPEDLPPPSRSRPPLADDHDNEPTRASLETTASSNARVGGSSPKSSLSSAASLGLAGEERIEIARAKAQDLSFNTAQPVFFSPPPSRLASPVPTSASASTSTLTLTAPASTCPSGRTSRQSSSLSKFARILPRADSPPCSPKTVLESPNIPDCGRDTPTPTPSRRPPSLLSPPTATGTAPVAPTIRLRKPSTDTAASSSAISPSTSPTVVAAPVYSTITALRRMNSESLIDSSPPRSPTSGPPPGTPPFTALPRGDSRASLRAGYAFPPAPAAPTPPSFHRGRDFRYRSGGGWVNDENVPPVGREGSKGSLLGGGTPGRGGKRRSLLLNASARGRDGDGEWRRRGGADWEEVGL